MARLSLEELYQLAEERGWATRDQQRYSLLGMLYQIATTEQLEMVASAYKRASDTEAELEAKREAEAG